MRAARRRPRRSPPDAAEPIPVREMPMSSFPLLSPMPIVPPESTRDGPAAAGPSFARLFLTEARRIAVLWTRYPLELLGGLLLLAFLFMVFAAIGSVTQGPFAVFAGNRTAMAMLYVLWTIVSTTVGAGASQVGADAAAGVLENLFLAAAPVERVLQARCVALLAQGCAIGLALLAAYALGAHWRPSAVVAAAWLVALAAGAGTAVGLGLAMAGAALTTKRITALAIPVNFLCGAACMAQLPAAAGRFDDAALYLPFVAAGTVLRRAVETGRLEPVPCVLALSTALPYYLLGRLALARGVRACRREGSTHAQ